MTGIQNIKKKIFDPSVTQNFNDLALALFHFHCRNNQIYSQYVDNLRFIKENITHFSQIPFLPVEFFKSHRICCTSEPHAHIFTSSGTTSAGTRSTHYIHDLGLYEESFLKGFTYFYGDIRDYCLVALLPSYLESENSSLIYMVNDLINKTNNPASGFCLAAMSGLAEKLPALAATGKKVILLGVTYALLDLAEQSPFPLPGMIVMETGGMKGRRREMIREQLHEILCNAFNINEIHSEYGMTELLSQAYSKGRGIFHCPPWMKVLTREVNDPLQLAGYGQTGGINIIDLANIYSCPFIATQDLGKVYPDGSFEVLGRFDHSQVRGCNLLVM